MLSKVDYSSSSSFQRLSESLTALIEPINASTAIEENFMGMFKLNYYK
jgi:hypothetical protein